MQDNNNAVITVKSVQESDGETEKTELVSDGSFYIRDGKYFVMYNENDTMKNSLSMVKVDGETVTVSRTGEYSMKMVCAENKTCSFVYRMPYGSATMGITTEKVDVSLGENGGTIRLVYELNTGGGIQRNSVSIAIDMK